MSKRPKMYFFGCNQQAGHHLYGPGGRWVHVDVRKELPFRYENLDGGILLPRPEKVGSGTLMYLFGWTILSWWGNPFDTRPGVCNAILVEGAWRLGFVEERFSTEFPELSKQLKMPNNIVWSYTQEEQADGN